ncbi:MAG: UDP-N-acetylglucosamine--N-acetylmuramyl-(pentapeptide) pyrophosphoryl-undecaprenol N-acetylglucosamine transferase [Christensenellales bacterium]
MKVALTGGGTAGHVMPNIALLPYLNRRFDQVLYIGNEGGIESKICQNFGVEFCHTDSVKFDRSKIFRNLLIPFILPRYVKQAVAILQKHEIDVVFSKGGYVALPVVLGAKKLGIPVVCHESDTSLGLANKITARFAKAVVTSHEGVRYKSKTYLLGNPVRDIIFEGVPSKVYDECHLKGGKPILLVVGGSLGARAINKTLVDCLDVLTTHYDVIHVTGSKFLPPEHDGYYPLAYADNIQDYLAAADVIVSRAGANFVDEILALGKKAVLIPLPTDASRGDQLTNASKVCSMGYARLLEQKNLTPSTLVDNIDQAYHTDFRRRYYDRNTACNIANLIYQIAVGGGK